jgi:hypothetical protein
MSGHAKRASGSLAAMRHETDARETQDELGPGRGHGHGHGSPAGYFACGCLDILVGAVPVGVTGAMGFRARSSISFVGVFQMELAVPRFNSVQAWRAIIKSSSVGMTQADVRLPIPVISRTAGKVCALIQIHTEPRGILANTSPNFRRVLPDSCGKDQRIDPAEGRGHRTKFAPNSVHEQRDRFPR